jgi:hypothetical protein
MGTKLEVRIFGTLSQNHLEMLREAQGAIEFVSQNALGKLLFNRQIKGGAGPAFKELVESTLQSRGWKKKREIVALPQRKSVKGLYYDRWKEEEGRVAAMTWGFHHQQAIMRNLLKPIYHEALDRPQDAPQVHIIVAPSQAVRKSLKMNSAQADSESFIAHLEILEKYLLVPTVLISLESIE